MDKLFMAKKKKDKASQSAIVGTTQTKILGVLALASLALSFAVGLKTSNFGMAFLGFALGALVLLLTLYDVNCVIVGGCDVWGWIKAVLIGIALVGVILMQIGLLSGPSRAPQATVVAQGPRGTLVTQVPQSALEAQM